jgi:hypothetical protein
MIILENEIGRGLLGKTPRVGLPKLARSVYSGFTTVKTYAIERWEKMLISKVVKNFCSF